MGNHPRKADGRRVFSAEFKRTTVQRILTGEKTVADARPLRRSGTGSDPRGAGLEHLLTSSASPPDGMIDQIPQPMLKCAGMRWSVPEVGTNLVTNSFRRKLTGGQVLENSGGQGRD